MGQKIKIGKVGLYSGGLGGQNSSLVRSLEYSVGWILVGATLRFYTEGPKIDLEPREVSFWRFGRRVFTSIFWVDKIVSKFRVFGTDFSWNGSPWVQIGVWSMKMDTVGFGKFGFDGRFGWKCRFWRNRGPKKSDFSADFLANFWWFFWGEP